MSEAPAAGFFRGSERLEPIPALGRLIRKGSPAELAVSDADRVRAALRARDAQLATGYLSIVRSSAEMMVTSYVEFVLAFAPALAAHDPPIDHADIYRRAHDTWRRAVEASPELGGSGAATNADGRQVAAALGPDTVLPSTVGEMRQALMSGGRTRAADLLVGPAADFERLSAALAAGDVAGAAAAFEDYYGRMRRLHDLLVELDSLLISVIAETCGSSVAGEILYQSFTGCLFYGGLWQLAGAMSAEELAAFLADHMRGHFSGPARDGTIDIVEEEDRIRLVFGRCGSGAAMRRRARAGVPDAAAPLAQAANVTWQRAGEVPGYCSHCAMNELEGVRRLGYPLMVTEFDPDPDKPCGWTIYRDPSFIPESYFRRIGQKKDPSRFPAR